jgi:hypothetical protein
VVFGGLLDGVLVLDGVPVLVLGLVLDGVPPVVGLGLVTGVLLGVVVREGVEDEEGVEDGVPAAAVFGLLIWVLLPPDVVCALVPPVVLGRLEVPEPALSRLGLEGMPELDDCDWWEVGPVSPDWWVGV